jgi:hypothetical protein
MMTATLESKKRLNIVAASSADRSSSIYHDRETFDALIMDL